MIAFNKIFSPLLACIIVLIFAETLLRSFNDFNLVYPYIEFFTNKHSRIGIHKGDLWGPKEFENITIRDIKFQHSRAMPDLSKEQKIIFLIGDSIVESASTPLDQSFHSIVDLKHPEYAIIAEHYAGCSLDAISILLDSYQQKFIQNGKVYKPDMVIAQLRGFSYQGGNTQFYDPTQGKNIDFQAKLNNEKQDLVVEIKQAILNVLKFDVKFSSELKDKILRDLILGKIHIFSLLSWRFYNWSISQSVPNNEHFIYHNLEDDYWYRFENSLNVFVRTANNNQIQGKILLIPDKRWFERYRYTRDFNPTEKRYLGLFQKYQVPYIYVMEDIYQEALKTNNPMFWHDGHPSSYGSKAIAKSLERLIL